MEQFFFERIKALDGAMKMKCNCRVTDCVLVRSFDYETAIPLACRQKRQCLGNIDL